MRKQASFRHVLAIVAIAAALASVSAAGAQQRVRSGPNAPPNPNWVITPWAQSSAPGLDWQSLKLLAGVTYDPNGQGSMLVLVQPPKPTDPCVWVYDLNGKFLRAWGANLFSQPYFASVDRFGYIWITDNKDNLVGKFTEDGQLVTMLGKKGVAGDNTSHDLFNGPTDVAVAANGDFFVSDGYGNSRVVKFDKNGKFLLIIGGSEGTGIGQFNLPHHVVIDSKGELVVMDRMNKRIQFWTQDGKFIKQWDDIEFGYPSGMQIMADDTVYIGDSDGNSFKIIKDDKVLDAVGGYEGLRPHQLAVDPTGAVYINDGQKKEIRKAVRKTALKSQLTPQ
jgi:DNA-binding beta-propeller fold protein YncE